MVYHLKGAIFVPLYRMTFENLVLECALLGLFGLLLGGTAAHRTIIHCCSTPWPHPSSGGGHPPCEEGGCQYSPFPTGECCCYERNAAALNGADF